MEGIRNALQSLRLEIEEGSVRTKDAEARRETLELMLKGKEDELASLQEQLSLTRKLICVADRWDMTHRTLRETKERILQADIKVERLKDKLQSVETGCDAFEGRYRDVRAKNRELENELTKLLV